MTGANVAEQRKEFMFVWVLTHYLRQSKASKRRELQGREELLGRFCEVVWGPHDGRHLGQVSEKENMFASEGECVVR